MTAVGDKQVLLTQTLLLSDDEVARFDLTAGGTTVPVAVRFRHPDAPESFVRWQMTDGVLNLDFTGWGDGTGEGFSKPERIGTVDGQPLGLNFVHQRIGEMNWITLQLYWGGRYE